MRISSRARNDDGKCNDFGCEGNENVYEVDWRKRNMKNEKV